MHGTVYAWPKEACWIIKYKSQAVYKTREISSYMDQSLGAPDHHISRDFNDTALKNIDIDMK